MRSNASPTLPLHLLSLAEMTSKDSNMQTRSTKTSSGTTLVQPKPLTGATKASRALVASLCAATLVTSSCGGGGGAGDDAPEPPDPNFEFEFEDARQEGGVGWEAELAQLRSAPVQLAASAGVGSLPGRAWADDGGGAHYAIPIDVAPGPNGHAPSLSLGYSSHGGNGLYGVGFSVGTASQVTRCQRTMAKDGEFEALTMGQFDPICYGGQRLILSAGTYGLSGSEYRLESDPSKRFRYSGEPGLQAIFVGVWYLDTADGQTFEFVPLDGARDRWHLYNVKDTFGNTIDYNWSILADHEVVLASIAYGGTGTVASQRKVIFDNEAGRPDEREGYVRGELFRRTQRVAGIRAEGPNGELLTEYEFTYGIHPDTRQSILTEVRMLDGSGVALPPTEFEWERQSEVPIETDGARGVVGKSHLIPLPDVSTLRRNALTTIGDFTGNGESNVLTFDPADGHYYVDGDLALLTGGPEVLPGGWEALDEGMFLHRIQQSPGIMRIKYSAEDGRDQLLVPVDSETIGDDGRDAWGVSTVNSLRVALPLGVGASGALDFDYVDYPMSEPVYTIVPLEFNGDGRDDLFLCQGQGYKSSHWVLALTRDVANTAAGTYGWDFYDTGVGCSTHDEYTVLPHERGTEVLAVIPRFEWRSPMMLYPDDFLDGNNDPDPDAYQAGVLPWLEPSRGDYRVLEFDPDDGEGTGGLGPDVLPRDLYQRWTDRKCNNGFVADALGDAPLLGAGLSRDRAIDVDGDGLRDIIRFELSGGDTFAQINEINAEAQDNGSGYSDDVQCSPDAVQNGVLRVYRNTGDGYELMAAPALTFAGSPHANLWLNWYGAQLRDWNADGLLDIALPSDGVADDPSNTDEDWLIMLSNGNGSFLPLDVANSNSAPDWPHYISGSAVQPVFDDFATTRTFAATDRVGPREWLSTQIFLRAADYLRHWESSQNSGVKLHRATDGYGFWNEFEYGGTPHGRTLVNARTANVPTDAAHPEPDLRTWTYEYSDSVLDAYGASEVGFAWVRETFRKVIVGASGAQTQRRFYDWSYDPSVRAYPHAGTPRLVESAWVSDRAGPGEAWHLQCREINSWTLEAQALSGGQIWQAYPDEVESYSTTQSPSNYNFLEPRHPAGPGDLSQCEDYSASGYEVHSTSAHSRDDYGNVIESTAEALVGVSEYTKTTTTYEDFKYDPASWVIASPERAREESCVGKGAEEVCKDRTSRVLYDPSVSRFAPQSLYREFGTAFEQGVYFEYDGHGNVSSSTLSAPGEEPRVSTTQWDAEGVTPLSSTNALEHETNFVFHNTSGLPVATVDANGLTQKASYDGFFRPVGSSFHSSPMGPSDGGDVEVSYQSGSVSDTVLDVVTEQRGQEVVTSYDRVGRAVRELWHGVETVSSFPMMSPTGGQVTGQGPETCRWHEYNVFGDQLGSSEATSSCAAPPAAASAWARHEFDVGGRHIASRWFDDGVEVQSSTTHTDYEWAGFTAVPGNTELKGHAVLTTDADGRPTTSVTDALGRLSATVDALGTMTCFDYGPFGELEGVHRNCEFGATGTMESSSYLYDPISRLVQGTEPARGAESFTYTGFDELKTLTDAKSQVIEHEFDVLGRLRVRRSPDCVARWSFDGPLLGALGYQLSEDGVKETFSYDEFGRLERSEHDVPGVEPSGPWTFDFDYDAMGRLSSIDYPTAPATTFGGTAATNFSATFDYDGSGHLRSVQGAGRVLWALNETNDAGLPLEESFNIGAGLGVQTRSSDYNLFTQRAKEIDVDAGGVDDAQRFRYVWSPGGDLLEREEQTTNQSESFGYDLLHRLMTINGAQEATYEALGNFTQRAGVGSYSYDSATGRLDWYGSAATTVLYDDNGNVESIGDVELDWTPFDKVRELSNAGEHLTFAYNIAGSRVARFDAAGFTLTLGGLFEYSSRDNDQSGETELKARYFVPVGGAVVEVRDETEQGEGGPWSREVLYQYNDHLGSGSVLVSEDGTVVQRVSFDAWGQARNWASWSTNFDPALLETLAAGYTGHQSELDLGLMNMRGRMYSPVLGLFLSVDPVVEAAGDAQTWNAYSYVLNNPLRYTDPSGHCAETTDWSEPVVHDNGSTVRWMRNGSDCGKGSVPQEVPGQNTGQTGGSTGTGDAGGGGGRSGTGGGNTAKSNRRGKGGPVAVQLDYSGSTDRQIPLPTEPTVGVHGWRGVAVVDVSVSTTESGWVAAVGTREPELSDAGNGNYVLVLNYALIVSQMVAGNVGFSTHRPGGAGSSTLKEHEENHVRISQVAFKVELDHAGASLAGVVSRGALEVVVVEAYTAMLEVAKFVNDKFDARSIHGTKDGPARRFARDRRIEREIARAWKMRHGHRGTFDRRAGRWGGRSAKAKETMKEPKPPRTTVVNGADGWMPGDAPR